MKIKNFHRIFEQIYENPVISLLDLASTTRISRNTVSKYMKEMYARNIMIGPEIRMNPSPEYKEYVYLMNFKDPFQVFKGLKGFPHVVYHSMALGDWTTMVITDRLLDLSQLVGFRNMVYQGVRGYSYTPKVEYIKWDECFKKIEERMDEFAPDQLEYADRALPSVTWGEDQWKLFFAFKYNMRKTVTPTLKEINVRYETYTEWMKTLKTNCTVHTGFYPEGYQNYMSYCFLVRTEYKESVKSLFSLFPTTSFFMEVDDHLMVFTYMPSSEVTRKLFCFIYAMKEKEIIKEFNQAVALFYCYQKSHSV